MGQLDSGVQIIQFVGGLVPLHAQVVQLLIFGFHLLCSPPVRGLELLKRSQHRSAWHLVLHRLRHWHLGLDHDEVLT